MGQNKAKHHSLQLLVCSLGMVPRCCPNIVHQDSSISFWGVIKFDNNHQKDNRDSVRENSRNIEMSVPVSFHVVVALLAGGPCLKPIRLIRLMVNL